MKLAFKQNSIEVTSQALGTFAVLVLSEYDLTIDNAVWISSDLTEYTPSENALPRFGDLVWSLNVRGRWLMARSLELGMAYVKKVNEADSKAVVENDGDAY